MGTDIDRKRRYRPLTDFFPALARKGPGRLRLRIPPTLILEGTDRALYFTEEQSGYIRRVAGDYCDDTIIAKMLLPSMKDPVAMVSAETALREWFLPI